MSIMDKMRQAAKPSSDKLEKAKTAVRNLRNMEKELADLQARSKEVGESIRTTKEKTLVDLFDEVGITNLGLPAEGNLPAYEIELGEYYHANIPKENEEEAYKFLRDRKQDDLIKTTFTVSFGLRESRAAKDFLSILKKANVAYSKTQGVPWNTLTAWFRVEHNRKPLPPSAMAVIGATVGRVAKVVKQKEKK